MKILVGVAFGPPGVKVKATVTKNRKIGFQTITGVKQVYMKTPIGNEIN
jgi:hypothetical protein